MAWAHNPNRQAVAWPEVALTASPLRTLALMAMSVAFGLLGGAAAFGYFDIIQPGSKGWLAGWMCLILSPVAIMTMVAQDMTRGAIVTVGPQGVRDVRISRDWIPWTAITGVSERSIKGTHFLMLRIEPAFEATISLTRYARWSKVGNAALGYHGHGIAAAGLKGGFKALKGAIADGLARASGG